MRSRRGKRHTILVVEDDARSREIYRTTLVQDGYRVLAVEDGFQALRTLEAERPHAIVLDLLMPRITGYDVYADLQADPATARIPVVIVTGADLRNLVPGGRLHVLHKPFEPDALLAEVSKAVAGL
jgi:putative two-component system response regulator